MPSFRLGSRRRPITSRWISTRPKSRQCLPCFGCAPRVRRAEYPHSRTLPCTLHRLRRRRSERNPNSPSIPHSSYALLWTLQSASAFNQPVSFDTSKVKSMSKMFMVRSAHALRPISSRAFSTAHCLRRPLPHKPQLSISRSPHFASLCMPSVRLGRARQRSTSR